ncbi:BTB/POZ domain-containing protein 16 [Patella vulgata]|uniref:BTB/POZ domain-containing protein 16 n=1 Tax=Patella vulgata TaxID=6465 RepID=UPI00217F8DE6|nr:BTB/POZ domain-containing protein 16 [Patella vulgata]
MYIRFNCFKNAIESCHESTFRTPNSLSELKTYTPKTALNPTPKETFLYHSKKALGATRPGLEKLGEHDVLLNCLKTDWELHRPFLQKSDTLAQLLEGAPQEATEQYYKQLPSEVVDDFIGSSHFYDKNYPKEINKLNTDKEFDDEVPLTSSNPSHYSKKRCNSVTVISLVVRDAMVTRKALALALGSLYTDDITISEDDAASVLAAASVLGFKQLIDRCKEIILRSINFRTVCKYHRAASQYNEDQLVGACEKWLELNFIPQVAIQIQLREVPMELIQKILKSNRLFVYNEYSIYRALVYWLFFQLNPDLQLMPSQSTIISFFNSLPKTSCIIEREEGQSYAALFSAIRLHGITDTSNIQDMQMMNVVPQKWLIDLLSQHYHSLQAGGDMASLKSFQQASVRYGFIIDTEPHYHSEIISLHGFHFELKAVKQGTSKTYVVYLQRLKPGDPVLSFRQCERHTFSMRPERTVRYNISVNYYDNSHQLHEISTGVVSNKFGLGERTSRSETLTVENAEKPLYISFAIHFPPS